MFGPVFVGGGIGIEQAWVKNESYIEGYISPDGWDSWKGVKTFKGIRDNKKASPTFDMKAGSSLGMASWLFGEAGTGCRFDLVKTALAATIFIKGIYDALHPQRGRTTEPDCQDDYSGRELAKAKEQKTDEYSNVIKQLKKGQSIRNTAKLCGVSVSTVQRVKKEFGL